MSVEFLWCEKYRPKTIEDCILPESLKKTFTEIAEGGELPNMMFSGTAGVGKTTVARALCTQLDLDHIVINGSEEGNIDTLRGKIKQFASTVSLSGGYKVVILDEADYMNPQSTQPALRGFIEEFSKNCRFILTCNFKNRIIEPLHSRCSVYEFQIQPKERPKIAMAFFKRLQTVLKAENVEFEPASLVKLIEKHFPDWRRVLNECQRYSISGKIDAGVLTNVSNENIKALMGYLKDKDFKTMRKWVVDNIDVEAQTIFRMVYDNMEDNVKASSIPQLVLIIADYQHKNSFVADAEINLVAMFTEIMSAVEFK
jgi:DNA polymerase III delta prime subunit|tara:strand:- start:223 stop:1161 length:939 start_codon:yes stop_codon:yes gene_type:complete